MKQNNIDKDFLSKELKPVILELNRLSILILQLKSDIIQINKNQKKNINDINIIKKSIDDN